MDPEVLRDVARNEITAVCFAAKGRKLYCGDSRGEVRDRVEETLGRQELRFR